MTSRQARRERREAERKTRKAAYKAERSASLLIHEDEEFSPELIAAANAARERVEAQLAAFRASAMAARPDEAAVLSEPKIQANEAAVLSEPKIQVNEDAVLSEPKIQVNEDARPRPPHHPAAESPRSRAEINRANAQFSTGPRSPNGKLASSRNSLKHGLASGRLIIHGEDSEAFDALLENLLDEHQPASTTEELLVHEMAQSHWLTQRALRLQNDCFTDTGVDEKRLSLFLRYQTTHERAFHKALNALIRLQKDRRRAEKQKTGFVSQRNVEIPRERGFVSQESPSTTPEPQSPSQNRSHTKVSEPSQTLEAA